MTSVADETKVGDFQEVIRIDEHQLKGHVAEVVRQSVEETLNGLLEGEADAICGRSGTSGTWSGWTRERGTIRGSCRRRPGR